MKDLIASFPENIEESLRIATSYTLKKPTEKIKNVVICGMGGSGIGGKLVSQWLDSVLDLPVLVCQDYNLPKFVNDSTLVICSSYSGETEETLSCLNEAKELKALIIGISSGGSLVNFCKENNYDCMLIPSGNPPRTALAFSVGQLLTIFHQLGLTDDTFIENYLTSKKILLSNSHQIHQKAKELAYFLKGKNLLMYAASNYEAVAIRARQQFNENAKILCSHHVIPEMNHNELVGWGLADERFAVLIFDSLDWHPKNQLRLNFCLDHIKIKTPHIFRLIPEG
ncbi:MAG: SIS domain-containing protein, partial [Crocinitomicaceae bacterium]|nr:SIS domain-containing protein [Crocinitomicaceae bacterium]